MDDKYVVVTSMINGRVGLVVPHLRLNRVFPRKGTKVNLDKDILREAFYEPGVEYMFRQGILYIDDMPLKIELGLEEEGTKVPTDVIELNDKYLNRVAKLMPIMEMKQVIEKMNENQRQEVIDYIIKQSDISFDRLEAVKKITGVDVIKIIELNRAQEE